MPAKEFLERIQNVNQRQPKSLRDWSCDRCQGGGASVNDAILIDSDDEDEIRVASAPMVNRNQHGPQAIVRPLVVDTDVILMDSSASRPPRTRPSAQIPSAPVHHVTLPETIEISPSPPPPPATHRPSVESRSAVPAASQVTPSRPPHPLPRRPPSRAETNRTPSTTTAPPSAPIQVVSPVPQYTPPPPPQPDRAASLQRPEPSNSPESVRKALHPLPPQDIAFVVRLRTSNAELPSAPSAAEDEAPFDNMRPRYGPLKRPADVQQQATRPHPRTATSPKPSASRGPPREQAEEDMALDDFSTMAISGQDIGASYAQAPVMEVHQAANDDAADEDDESGLPEGFHEEPVQFISDSLGIGPLQMRQVVLPGIRSFPLVSTVTSKNQIPKEDLYPRLDMYFTYAPHVRTLPDDVPVPSTPSTPRRARKSRARQLDADLIGPEVIYAGQPFAAKLDYVFR